MSGNTGTDGTAGAAGLAEQVVDLVRATHGRGAQAEVLVEYEDQALTRFANSFIHQNVSAVAVRVALRLHVDGRTSAATTTGVDAGSLRALVERAGTAARLLPPDPLWAGLAVPGGPAAPGGAAGDGSASPVDPATAAAAPTDRAAVVRAFVDATDGLACAGFCRTTYVRAAFANTAGHAVVGAYTEAAMSGVARAAHNQGADGTADGVACAAAARIGDIDGTALGVRAATKARTSTDPVYLPPGTYEVVLEPEAVGDLLGNLGQYGFNAKAVLERRSFADLGAAQFDPALSIVDDPVAGRGFGLPYDTEGTTKRRLELVRAGVTTALTHDRRTAREAGTDSTGHASPESAVFGPAAKHLTIEAAGPVVADDVAALIANVRRGLLVTDFWYTRVLDPRPLVVTGLTRNGLWLIEDGAVTTPVRNLRFTQAYSQALAPGQLLGMTRAATTLPGGWDLSAHRAPALHLAAWRFTGGAMG